jgi:hypothetical protein
MSEQIIPDVKPLIKSFINAINSIKEKFEDKKEKVENKKD